MDDLLLAAGCAGAFVIVTRLARRLFPPPWHMWPTSRIVITFVGCMLLVWGAIILGLPWWLFAVVAQVLVIVSILVRRRRIVAIESAIRALRDPTLQASALAELRALHGPPPPASKRRYAVWASTGIYIGQSISRANLPEEALAWSGAIHVASLDPALATACVQLTAVCRIATGDRAGARRDIASIVRPAANALYDRALTTLETLLDALDGDAERAERVARLGAEAEKDKNLRVSWQIGRAHALARLGRQEEALAVLREIRTAMIQHPILERIVRHGGAASPLAATLLAEGRSAYR